MLIENPQGLGRHSSRRRWWMTRTSTKRTSLSRRVARSLEPRLGEIIRTWITAILPDQPFAELIVGGERTLRVAGSEGVKETAHQVGRSDARLAPPLRRCRHRLADPAVDHHPTTLTTRRIALVVSYKNIVTKTLYDTLY
jgi:hypothetical protein